MQGDTVERAFTRYRAQVDAMIADGGWHRFGDLFTPTARYRRHGVPELRGREQIRAWIVEQMADFPGNQIAYFTVDWRSCDERRRHVVYELRHTMADPGDGSRHEACTTSMLTYAGDGLWSEAADVHNPLAYRAMYRNWARIAIAHGRLTVEQQEGLALLGSAPSP